jgi:predicted DCC family thiol-disulfide oxidoreductase YuxK
MKPLKPVLTLLYDGRCPPCKREIAWLRSRNQQGRLDFQDIHDATFDPRALGLTIGDLMSEMHGVTAEGNIIKGVDVFAIAYSAAGLKWLAAAFQSPLMRPWLIRLYAGFARYRPILTGQWRRKSCPNGQCQN